MRVRVHASSPQPGRRAHFTDGEAGTQSKEVASPGSRSRKRADLELSPKCGLDAALRLLSSLLWSVPRTPLAPDDPASPSDPCGPGLRMEAPPGATTAPTQSGFASDFGALGHALESQPRQPVTRVPCWPPVAGTQSTFTHNLSLSPLLVTANRSGPGQNGKVAEVCLGQCLQALRSVPFPPRVSCRLTPPCASGRTGPRGLTLRTGEQRKRTTEGTAGFLGRCAMKVGILFTHEP